MSGYLDNVSMSHDCHTIAQRRALMIKSARTQSSGGIVLASTQQESSSAQCDEVLFYCQEICLGLPQAVGKYSSSGQTSARRTCSLLGELPWNERFVEPLPATILRNRYVNSRFTSLDHAGGAGYNNNRDRNGMGCSLSWRKITKSGCPFCFLSVNSMHGVRNHGSRYLL